MGPRSEERGDLDRLRWRNVAPKPGPTHLCPDIQAEIFMRSDVAHRLHLSPRKSGSAHLYLAENMRGRLADHYQGKANGLHGPLVLGELLEGQT